VTAGEGSTDPLLPPTQILDGVSVERLIGSSVGLAIRLIVSFKIYPASCNSTCDRHFPDSTLGGTTVEHELASLADVD
jgi:hypothetical protein